jgi:phospholipid/cholesterol/gamma-HCH transport system substrate-binding protein
MRRLGLLGGAALAAIVGIVVFSSGGDSGYRLKLDLANASGLRPGSAVVVGGAKVGHVSAVDLVQPGDRLEATLALDGKAAPVGRDVSASIAAVNLLGQKEIDLDLGNRDRPAPSGFEVPASKVVASTDLADVLNALDPDTRARLTVFLNEAGLALGGRKADLAHFLDVLPGGASDLAKLLSDLVDDNHTLGQLVQHSDTLVASLDARRAAAGHMVHNVGQTAAVVASRRQQLLATLHHAPGSLATTRRFLAQLQAATVPIRPAARAVTATAPALESTLAQLDPFREAADPVLKTARRVAPSLTRLAADATPTVRRAKPTTAALSRFSTQVAQSTGDIVNGSIDNIIAIVAQWGSAIQVRDSLSHIFRGEVALSDEAIRSATERLFAGQQRKHPSKPARPGRPPAPAAPLSVPQITGQAMKKPSLPALPSLPKVSVPLLSPQVPKQAATALLDYLLGGG